MGLWVAFAAMIPSGFAWLKGRLWLAGLLGAIFGPLSYASGVKLGALQFGPWVESMMGVAVLWLVAFPALVWVGTRMRLCLRPHIRLQPRLNSLPTSSFGRWLRVKAALGHSSKSTVAERIPRVTLKAVAGIDQGQGSAIDMHTVEALIEPVESDLLRFQEWLGSGTSGGW